MIWVAFIILFLLVMFSIFIVYRLNIYIQNLETKFLEQKELTENLKQSLKDIIAEGALQNDGRLKKFRIQKERNFIYNGNRLDEDVVEL